MFTLLKELNIWFSFENIVAKEEIAHPAGPISSLAQCFQMSSAAAEVKMSIYGVKG